MFVQLQTVRFSWLEGIDAGYCRALLTTYGDRFLRIQFHVSSFNLLHLVPCTKLQVLSFDHSCSLITPESAVQDINKDVTNFLPNLQKLAAGCCLGKSSRLFETRRPSLTKVDLLCCHLENPLVHDLSSWDDLPNLWPNIEELKITTVHGLTLDKLRRFVPLLESIKFLSLSAPSKEVMPTEMDKALAEDYRVEQKHNSIQMRFDLKFEHYGEPCIYPLQ